MSTAVMVDGAYFLRRFKRAFHGFDHQNPEVVRDCLMWLVQSQLALSGLAPPPTSLGEQNKPYAVHWAENSGLYRIFFYDCEPLSKKMHHPISGCAVDLSKSQPAEFRRNLHAKLFGTRKVALRLGRLNDTSFWKLSEMATKRLLKAPSEFVARDEDFEIDVKQKGVDMRLGLDVASMAFKRQVNKMILIAGDADFVPAVKLARREGLDVIVVSMGDVLPADLSQNVDGIRTFAYINSVAG
jgi:uncharacterized LabA/DUF88 family protein